MKEDKTTNQFTYHIINNFLEKEFFDFLKNTITYQDFPWRRRPRMTQGHGSESDKGYLTYNFFNDFKTSSELYEQLIIPIMKKLNAKALIEARANLMIRELFISNASNYHTDGTTGNYTAILNLTNCDGGTHLMVDNKELFIQSKENSILIFNPKILHRSVRNNNSEVRYCINLNYY
tara:strand:+ start:701 stop:1231 length:531 start_codon:yes stop_codon:yes gene_type:complete